MKYTNNSIQTYIVVFGLCCLWQFVFAHPGRLDANGCHTNRKTGEYHCHRAQSSTASKNVSKSTPAKTQNTGKKLTAFSNVKLVSVYDGDTFKVKLPCEKEVLCEDISVRVKGIDTAERKGKGPCEKQASKQARNFTKQFLGGGQIDLLQCQRDKYFRLLCDVSVEGDNLSTLLLKNKLAVPYAGGKKETVNWCERLNLKE